MKPTAKTPEPIIQLSPKFILAASTDPTRPVLHGIVVDAENRAIVATNGRILAKIEIPGTAAIKAGYITAELWKAAKAMTKKGPIVVDYAAGTVGGLPYMEPDHAGNYPNWPKVIPAIENPVFRFGFDPVLALDLAQALGLEGKKAFAIVEADGVAGNAMRFSVGGHHGVLMPASSAKDGPPHGLLVPAGTGDATPQTLDSPFDRASMVRDPIPWLKRLDVELRYLSNNTPHGSYISDYLGLVDADAYVSAEEKEETDSDLKEAEAEAEAFKDIITKISEAITARTDQGFDAPAELGNLLHFIAFLIEKDENEFPVSSKNLMAAITAMQKEGAMPTDDRITALQGTIRTQAARVAELEDLLKELQRPVATATTAPAAMPKAERSAKPQSKEKESVSSATRPPTLTRNDEKNGIELRFDGKPSDADRDAMKAKGFRWCPGQPGKPWVARYEEERWLFAIALSGQTDPSPAAPASQVPPTPEPEAHVPASPPARARNLAVGGLVDF